MSIFSSERPRVKEPRSAGALTHTLGAGSGKSHEFVSADTTGPETITIDCNILFQNTPNSPTGESPVGCVSDP